MQATEPATVLVVGDSAWGAAVAKALKALPNLLVLTTRLGKEGENGEVAFKIDATPKGIAARLSELNVRLVVNCLGWGSSGTMLLLGGVMNSTHYLDASKTGCCQVHEGLHELAIRQGATCVLHCAGLVPSVADLIATLFVDEGGGGGEDIAAHIDYFWHGTGEVDLKVQRPSLIGMGKEIKFDTINAVVFALESDGKEGVCIGMVSEWFTKALDWLPAGLMQWVGNRYGQAVSLRVSVMGKDNCLRVHRQTHASALQSEAQLVAFQALELLSPSSSSSACPQDEDKRYCSWACGNGQLCG
ncbi:hypothetical protein BASA81_015178 [Batrachochytrium salamandrivorans]|nr:hypothetical protein BASA81_015178 [Batrachochytrium salamandrivorans]